MEEIKRIPNTIIICEFKINFSYDTRKGYYREQARTVKAIDKDMAKKCFIAWSDSQRTMVNVKILGIVEIEENRQEIVL